MSRRTQPGHGAVPPFPPVPFFAALVALAAWAAACLLVRMSEYGVVISWDAVHYISVARSLLEGNGFVAANGSDMAAWAPFWPVLLAAAGALASADPREVAGPLNAVLLGLCVLAAGSWMRRSLDSRFLVVWGCLVVALSPVLTLDSTRALSDTAFVLFATLALTNLDRRVAGGGGGWGALLWAAVFTGLAWATRYVGVAVAIAAVAALALRRGASPSDKVKEIAVYSLISAAPVGAWMARNFLVAGWFVAPPHPVDFAWWEAVDGILESFGGLAIPDAGSGIRETVGGLFLLALAAALVMSAARPRMQGASRDSRGSLRLFGGFVFLFLCLYGWAAVEGHTWHGAQRRHLLPVYIPFLFALLLAADRFLDRERRRPPKLSAAIARWTGAGTGAGLALVATLSLWVLWNAPAHTVGTLEGEGADEGYIFDWRDSEVMRWLRDNPSDTALSSNDVYAVYINATDGAGAAYRHLSANRPVGLISGGADPRDALQLSLGGAIDGDRIVWLFDESEGRLYDYDAADMRARAGLRLVADLADGAVFEVDKAFDGGVDEWRSVASAVGPAVRAVFDVSVREKRLIYVRKPCVRADTRAKFFLHVFPDDDGDLPDDRKRHGFVDLGFDFARRGARFEETCVAMVALPEWRIARVVTGQLTGRNRLWEAEIPIGDGENGPRVGIPPRN